MIKNNRLTIKFYLNEKAVETMVEPNQTALQLLREEFLLTGAKESCNEGDCGACTIALGKWQEDKYIYLATNSCILPATKLHGCHVITIEGLGDEDHLHIIQRAILENRATQCGYCTPGVIMSLFCLLANNSVPTQAEVLAALEGNLCRCTGYLAINKAAQYLITAVQADPAKFQKLLFPEYARRGGPVCPPENGPLCPPENGPLCPPRSGLCPTTCDELFKLMADLQGDYKIINGGTDIMVAANIHHIYHHNLLDISNIAELKNIEKQSNNIAIGGAVTLTDILTNELIQEQLPILPQAIAQMASAQIRNIATLVGNIANASPIGDAACVSLGLGAVLTLKNSGGEREVALEDFYQGYKKIVLNSDEIISLIKIPITTGKTSFEKSAKRTAVDIATANSLFNLTLKNQTIDSCRLALGGVAPYPMLAQQCAEFLHNKKLTAENIKQAAEIAMAEFTPISDIRGSDNYRNLLIRNHVIKHLTKIACELGGCNE